jgi:hypothetical protein
MRKKDIKFTVHDMIDDINFQISQTDTIKAFTIAALTDKNKIINIKGAYEDVIPLILELERATLISNARNKKIDRN